MSPGSNASSPIAMSRNEEPQIAPIDANSPQSSGVNAPRGSRRWWRAPRAPVPAHPPFNGRPRFPLQARDRRRAAGPGRPPDAPPTPGSRVRRRCAGRGGRRTTWRRPRTRCRCARPACRRSRGGRHLLALGLGLLEVVPARHEHEHLGGGVADLAVGHDARRLPLRAEQVRRPDGLDHLGDPVAGRERRLRPFHAEDAHGREPHRRLLDRRDCARGVRGQLSASLLGPEHGAHDLDLRDHLVERVRIERETFVRR